MAWMPSWNGSRAPTVSSTCAGHISSDLSADGAHPMIGYFASRFLYALAVIFGVSLAVFFLVRIGGDPSALFLPPETSLEEIARFRHEMGFDRPLPVQYAEFLLRA